MNKTINSTHLNTSTNFYYLNPYYHQKKLSYSNPYINEYGLNTASENQSKYTKLRISLPIKVLKTKIINSNIGNKTIETTFSPKARIKIGQPMIFNNNSIYYSKHKNKTTFINNYLNSEIKLFPEKNEQNTNKTYILNNNLNSKEKFIKENQKYNCLHNKNKTSFINSHLNTEMKYNKNKENQKNINNCYTRNNATIKKILDFKKNNSSKINFRNKHTSENTKNDESLQIENNFFLFKTCYNSKNTKNDKKSINKLNKFNNNKIFKVFRCMPKKLSTCISPKNLLLKNEKGEILKSSKFSSSNKNNSEIENPKIINRNEFKIINQIGSGSFGQIYKVLWNKNNEKYAMKIMITNIKDNMLYIQEKVHLFIDFIEKTNCDGLIKIYGDTYTKKGDEYHYYEIMQLAEMDWEQEIKIRNEKLKYYSEWELFTILSQLVKTLSLLQKNHITHRDIKIQNILLLNKKYKICDFGEARKLNQKGVIVQPARGSELYMSPIQFFGLNQKLKQVQHNTYKSDVFSLGMCILFAATLSEECLYDIRELTDMNHIKNILESYLSKRYSNGFIRLLLCFLEVDEKERPDFIQMEKIISQIKIK